jgi:HEAT repeat protein
MALGIAAVLLLAALAWFVGAVAVPAWQVRRAVGRFNAKNGFEIVDILGGEERARGRLVRYLYWPDWLAPDKNNAAELLSGSPSGPAAIVAILRDQQDPMNVRIAVADYLGTEQTSSMDNEDWKEEALASVLDDPCGLVRVAAAKNILTIGYIYRPNGFGVALGQLVACLGDQDVQVRRAAAVAAVTTGDRLKFSKTGRDFFSIAKPALEAALNDPDPEVQASAANALQYAPKPVRRFSGEEANKAE